MGLGSQSSLHIQRLEIQLLMCLLNLRQMYSCVPNTRKGCNKRAGVLNLLDRAFLLNRFYVVKMAKQAGKSSNFFRCEHTRVLVTPEYTYRTLEISPFAPGPGSTLLTYTVFLHYRRIKK